MRILHVPHAYHPVVGGSETVCKRVSEILAADGHDVRVVTTNVGAVQGYYEFGIPAVRGARETIAGVDVVRLPFNNWLYRAGGLAARSRPRGIGTRLAARSLAALRDGLPGMIAAHIDTMRPDVVMTMPHLVVNVQAVLAARERIRFPLVMAPMLHEEDPDWDAASMASALRLADAVIAQTAHEARRLVEAYGVPPGRVFLGSVGIDLLAAAPEQNVTPEARVLFLGRQVRTKGIADLIEAMRLVWRSAPEVELCLAGGRVPESAVIDRQVAELPANQRRCVRNLDAVPGDTKSELLRSSSCLVLPSKIESFGMVILDAWAHGRPVVAWDLPVFRSIVDHGRTGLLADPARGPAALADAILDMLRNPEAATRMGEAGRQEAGNRYSWRVVADAYLKAYEYAASNPRSA